MFLPFLPLQMSFCRYYDIIWIDFCIFIVMLLYDMSGMNGLLSVFSLWKRSMVLKADGTVTSCLFSPGTVPQHLAERLPPAVSLLKPFPGT